LVISFRTHPNIFDTVLVTFIAVCIVSYLIGSFPTAYIVVKRKSGFDIRREGSGNVGAMNAFEVTGNSHIGLFIMIIDAMKGVAAVGLTQQFTNGYWWLQTTALLSVVIGQSYSVWIHFHGGRGLATAAGAMLLIGWIFVVLWVVVWSAVYLLRKDILVGNLAALIIAPIILFFIPDTCIENIIASGFTVWKYFISTCFLIVVLLTTHMRPIKELLFSEGKR
jgi:glycerol-3-phosphate acyltransferase PlsY